VFESGIREVANDLKLRKLISDEKIKEIAQHPIFVRTYPTLYTSLMLSKNLDNLNDNSDAQDLSGGRELLRMVTCLKIKRAVDMALEILEFLDKNEKGAIESNPWNDLKDISARTIKKAKKQNYYKTRKATIMKLHAAVVTSKKIFENAKKLRCQKNSKKIHWLKHEDEENGFAGFKSWCFKKITRDFKSDKGKKALMEGFNVDAAKPGKMQSWQMLSLRIFRCIFHAIDMEAVNDRIYNIFCDIVPSLFDSFHVYSMKNTSENPKR
jgi:hypothetical protein